MSSLFNYELDENKIRLTLQQARPTSFNENDWKEFELVYLDSNCNSNKASAFKLPEFNLNINRNVILPALFILALIGISAVLISFIDFKTEEKNVEHKLEPNPNNYKPVTPSKVKPEIVPAKKMVAQTLETVKKDTAQKISISNPQVVNTNTISSSNAVQTLKASQALPSAVASQSVVPVTITAQTSHRTRRKKTEKIETEQIETIKAPALIKTEPETSEQEPDLEIKMD